jgi:serine/threonine-protein phosphatase 2A regulatory subunit B''
MIDRIFSGAVTRGQGHVTSHRTPHGHVVRREEKHRMSYPEFIWFLISEEDKRHPTAIEYWFR